MKIFPQEKTINNKKVWFDKIGYTLSTNTYAGIFEEGITQEELRQLFDRGLGTNLIKFEEGLFKIVEFTD